MNIVLLTKFYPFGSGEAFVENEIKILAERYNKVFIVACDAPNRAPMRKVPNNATVIKINGGNRKAAAIINTISGIKYLFSADDGIKLERKKCRTMAQKMFLGYFEAKSRRIYRKILQNGFMKECVAEPFAVYSYWLFTTARAGCCIKDDFNPVYMFSRAHGYDLYQERNRLNYLPFRTCFAEYYDKIFPCSENGCRYLKNMCRGYEEKIETALLGTADHSENNSGEDKIFFNIVSCSRVNPEKRVEKIVEALTLIKPENKICWTHIGDGAEFERLQKLCRLRLNNMDHVKYILTGGMPNAQVIKLYSEKKFDLFVNVSSSEGLPVSIMEAISFGMPVVATDVGGTAEIVKDNITGKLLKKDFTAQQLARQIEEFIARKKDDEYDSIRKSCRKFWENNFMAEKNYNLFYDKITRLIEEKQRKCE